MSNEQPIVDGEFLLEKFPGKGGWTYASLPSIPPSSNTPFGWVRVRGRIDDFVLEQYKLMPMGNGHLFLPVKAQIRKKIKKAAGDRVWITLYLNERTGDIPPEIAECLKEESMALYETFAGFTDHERKLYLDWVYDAKTEAEKAERIVEMMDRLGKGLKYFKQ